MTAGSAPGRAAGPVRTIFFGSGAFAVPILDALADAPAVDLVAIVTTPDRPAGRSRTPTPTPVAVRAIERGLPILRPAGVRSSETLAQLAALAPELGVLADYGRIIPPALLELPRLGILGVHPSLLPRHRGATPIQATILGGDTEAGVAIYRMDAGLDTGPLLATRSWPLSGSETGPQLEEAAAVRGAALLLEALPAYVDGSATLHAQGPAPSGVTTRLTRDAARLDPSRTAAELERQVRAFAGWPGTWLETRAGRLVVLEASVSDADHGTPAGTLVEADGNRPAVAAADGRLLVLERVQPAGGRPMAGADFLRGHRDLIGTEIGSDDGAQVGTPIGGAATVSGR